jgi:DNA-binding CsgD family transcriptional regulator
MHPRVRVVRPTHPNGWDAGGRTILLSVQATQALDALIDVFAAPPEDATRRISAALSGVLPHRAAAVLAGACARSPMTVHGESGVAERITSADLARLAATVRVGEAWRGAAVVAGEERAVLAVAAGAGSLLVLVLPDGAEPDPETVGLVQRLWTVAAERMGHAIEEAEPTALAASRQAASERARVTAELTEAHAAALAALLGTLRARDLDDRAARRAATDLAASALVELRSAARRERELTDEPATQAFALLRDELRPLVRYSSAELEFAPPAAADGTLPGTVAQAARAIVRGAVVTMLEQQADVGRIRVAWEQDGAELRVSVRDDGPGRLAEEVLALHALTARARAVDGELRVESVPGWGSHVHARLPLGPVRDTAVPAGPLDALNPREVEVLGQLVRGRRNRQIAATLGISENTVKFHVANVLAKLGAASRGEAAAIAVSAGFGAPLHAVA